MRLVSIQYLRAVAVLLVVIAHSFGHGLDHETSAVLFTGRFGVVIFFVISGFIMVAITGEGRFDPLRFAGNRLRRIVPLYWTPTLVAAIFGFIQKWVGEDAGANWPTSTPVGRIRRSVNHFSIECPWDRLPRATFRDHGASRGFASAS